MPAYLLVAGAGFIGGFLASDSLEKIVKPVAIGGAAYFIYKKLNK